MARRRLAWSDTVFDSTTLVPGTQQKFNLLVNAPTTDTLTVERIILDLTAYAGPTNEVEGAVAVDVSIGVSAQEAFENSDLPDSEISDEYPIRGWLYVATKPVYQALPTGATPTAMWRQDAHFQADLRAKRKIDKGVLYLRLMTVIVSNTLTVFRTGRVRVLCAT